MANYLEQNVVGTAYFRANAIHIQNDFGAAPVVTISEEKIVSVDGEALSKPTYTFTEQFAPDEVVDIIDPTTGEATGATMTVGELHTLIHSYYIHVAKKNRAVM
jgi:hypothetical protein